MEKQNTEEKTKAPFKLYLSRGAVLPLNNPRYRENLMKIRIKKTFFFTSSSILIGKEKYHLTKDMLDDLYHYVGANLNELSRIASNTIRQEKFGGWNVIKIKYKSKSLKIDDNHVTIEDSKFIHDFEKNIKDIIINSKKI